MKTLLPLDNRRERTWKAEGRRRKAAQLKMRNLYFKETVTWLSDGYFLFVGDAVKAFPSPALAALVLYPRRDIIGRSGDITPLRPPRSAGAAGWGPCSNNTR